MSCPSCGEDDVIYVDHPLIECDPAGDTVTHSYCRNCDWGLCGEAC